MCDIFWFSLNPCLLFHLCRCFLCWCSCFQVNIYAYWCLKCYFGHHYFYIWCIDKLSILSLYSYALETYLLYFNCTVIHSYRIIVFTLVFSDVFRYCISAFYPYLFWFYIVIQTKPKNSLLFVEVPEHCWDRSLGSRL